MSAVAGRARRGAVLLLVAALLGGCNALVAQNPRTAMRPVNAVYRVDEPRMMLRGYDVVAYFTQGSAVRGVPAWRSSYEGVAYHFVNADNRDAFERSPARYQPAYHGFDATRIVYAIPEDGDPGVWRVIDGRLFIFADAASLAAFELDAPANIGLADRYWADEVAGSVTWWQRSWRSIDRVPHYKSRDDLANEVAAARPKPG
jgi:YHS domain-containing protein